MCKYVCVWCDYKQTGWFILRIVFILVGFLHPICSGLIFSITCLSRARLRRCGTVESWLSHRCGTVESWLSHRCGTVDVGVESWLSHRCGTVELVCHTDVGLSMWDCRCGTVESWLSHRCGTVDVGL